MGESSFCLQLYLDGGFGQREVRPFAVPVHVLLKVSCQVLKHLQRCELPQSTIKAKRVIQKSALVPYQVQTWLVILLYMLDTQQPAVGNCQLLLRVRVQQEWLQRGLLDNMITLAQHLQE